MNKSLAIFQWQQDVPKAEALCKEALEIDPDCDVAVQTLAQLSLQQGRIDEAITWFERTASLARTEAELVNAITCKQEATLNAMVLIVVIDEHASRAQQSFLQVSWGF